MGFFTRKTPEEKEKIKQEKALKYEASLSFCGETLQVIGKIPVGKCVELKLKPNEQVLNIHHDKIDITLPYDRIVSFRLENEVTLAKSGSGLGGALVGGALFGVGGAIVGQNSKKGKTKVKWIATLVYNDKDGITKELNFIQWAGFGYYEGDSKTFGAGQFESKLNEIAGRYGDDITEL